MLNPTCRIDDLNPEIADNEEIDFRENIFNADKYQLQSSFDVRWGYTFSVLDNESGLPIADSNLNIDYRGIVIGDRPTQVIDEYQNKGIATQLLFLRFAAIKYLIEQRKLSVPTNRILILAQGGNVGADSLSEWLLGLGFEKSFLSIHTESDPEERYESKNNLQENTYIALYTQGINYAFQLAETYVSADLVGNVIPQDR